MTVLAQHRMGRSWRVGIDDRPTGLVTGGLFSFCRNPIFTGMFVSFFGLVMMAPSPWSAGGFVAVVAAISLQVRYEERHVLGMHGTDYAAYGSRVCRFLPWLGRLG